MWERRNDTRPVPCDDDGMFSRASRMEGWTRDETGSCCAVKGDVDACDPPPEARVPRLDRCCYEQKVGYGRHHSLSGERPKSTFVSRGATAFEIFWRGSPPVEPGLGFASCFSRRIGWSSVLDIVEVSVQVSVKTARGQIGRPDFRSGRVLRLSRLLRQLFRGFQDLMNRVGWTGR